MLTSSPRSVARPIAPTDCCDDRTVYTYTVSQKTPHLYNLLQFYIHSSIATIFGTNLAEKVGNQNLQSEKNVKQQYLLQMSPQYGELRPTSG